MARHRFLAFVVPIVVLALGMAPARAGAQNPDPRPLIELIPPDGQGRLYTMSESEAGAAVRDRGYSRVQPPVAWMWTQAVPGSWPVFRLQWKVHPSSYLLTAGADERDRLVASGNFKYEGVVGYAGVLTAAQPPGTTRLWRYSKDGVWRVVTDAGRAQLLKEGYKEDGRLGYAYPGPVTNPPALPPGPPPSGPPGGGPPPAPEPALCRGVEGPTVRVDRRSRRTVRFGRRPVLSGRIRGADGAPVVGVEVRALSGGRKPQDLARGQTSRTGAFRLRLPRGPSRTVRLGVPAAAPGDALMCATVRVRVRAGVRLSVPRVVRGRRIRFSGRLRGEPVPRRGVVVELLAFDAGRWRQFRSVRTTRRGRFKTAYRLARTRGPRTFRFRARVRAQSPYPYALGTSRTVRVRVIP